MPRPEDSRDKSKEIPPTNQRQGLWQHRNPRWRSHHVVAISTTDIKPHSLSSKRWETRKLITKKLSLPRKKTSKLRGLRLPALPSTRLRSLWRTWKQRSRLSNSASRTKRIPTRCKQKKSSNMRKIGYPMRKQENSKKRSFLNMRKKDLRKRVSSPSSDKDKRRRSLIWSLNTKKLSLTTRKGDSSRKMWSLSMSVSELRTKGTTLLLNKKTILLGLTWKKLW